MNDFHFELMIAAPPADVFAALTTQAGLRNWWTRTCDVGGGVGARATFRFGKTYKIMEILVARPDSEIRCGIGSSSARQRVPMACTMSEAYSRIE